MSAGTALARLHLHQRADGLAHRVRVPVLELPMSSGAAAGCCARPARAGRTRGCARPGPAGPATSAASSRSSRRQSAAPRTRTPAGAPPQAPRAAPCAAPPASFPPRASRPAPPPRSARAPRRRSAPATRVAPTSAKVYGLPSFEHLAGEGQLQRQRQGALLAGPFALRESSKWLAVSSASENSSRTSVARPSPSRPLSTTVAPLSATAPPESAAPASGRRRASVPRGEEQAGLHTGLP